MLRLAIMFLALACGAAVAAGADIRIVESWVQYRDVLRSEGKTEAKIDSEIASDLVGLRAMDRSAGNDRIGVAAPPFQFDAWLNSPPLSLEDLSGDGLCWFVGGPTRAHSAPAVRLPCARCMSSIRRRD